MIKLWNATLCSLKKKILWNTALGRHQKKKLWNAALPDFRRPLWNAALSRLQKCSCGMPPYEDSRKT